MIASEPFWTYGSMALYPRSSLPPRPVRLGKLGCRRSHGDEAEDLGLSGSVEDRCHWSQHFQRLCVDGEVC